MHDELKVSGAGVRIVFPVLGAIIIIALMASIAYLIFNRYNKRTGEDHVTALDENSAEDLESQGYKDGITDNPSNNIGIIPGEGHDEKKDAIGTDHDISTALQPGTIINIYTHGKIADQEVAR